MQNLQRRKISWAISKRSIVTAGHCLCKDAEDVVYDTDNDYRFIQTCPNICDDLDKDLNNNMDNKITALVGATGFPGKIVPEFKVNIEAYLYKIRVTFLTILRKDHIKRC